MTKLTLTNLANLQNEQTAVSVINNNNTAIEEAIERTLTRFEISNNRMEDADLDMNSNRIFNLPFPINDTEPVRRIDLAILGGGNGNGGTVGVLSIDGVIGSLTTGATLDMVGQVIQTAAIFGDVAAPAGSFNTTIQPGVVTNAKLSNMNPASFKGRNLATPSTGGPVQDLTIAALGQKTAPNATTDWLMIQSSAPTVGDLQRVNLTQLSTALNVGVTSIEGLTGAINLTAGSGISIANIAGNAIQITNTGGGTGAGGVDSIGGATGVVEIESSLDIFAGDSLGIHPNWMRKYTSGSPAEVSVIVGQSAANLVGDANTVMGSNALQNSTGASNTIAIGNRALQGDTASRSNVAIGVDAMATPEAFGGATITFTVLPIDGTQVTIGVTAGTLTGARIYTFRNSPSTGDWVRIVPANLDATITNLANAINATGGVLGTDYGVTLAHTRVTAAPNLVNNNITVNCKTKLASNNGIPVSTTVAGAGWNRPSLHNSGVSEFNIAIGQDALKTCYAGANVGIGYQAGKQVQVSDQNVIIGYKAGFGLGGGLGSNVVIGDQAGFGTNNDLPTHFDNAYYDYCVHIGQFAGQWSGFGATFANRSIENVCIGATAGLGMTTGSNNVAIGANAMAGAFDPIGNLDPPGRDYHTEYTGSNSVAIGDRSMLWIVGAANTNTAIGAGSLASLPPEGWSDPNNPGEAPLTGIVRQLYGNSNVAVGFGAMTDACRGTSQNVSIGLNSGQFLSVPLDDDFERNELGTIIGPYANKNTFIGHAAGQSITTGRNNTVIGGFASNVTGFYNALASPYGTMQPGPNTPPGITTGHNNTIIGNVTGLAATTSNNVILASGIGVKTIWWDGANLKFPNLVTPAQTTPLAMNSSGNVVFTVISPASGGTGINAYAQGDMIYSATTNPSTLSVLTKSTVATHYLSNTGTNNNPAWAQVNLATGVSGNLPVQRLNGGPTPGSEASVFWRGDATWAVPPGGVGGGVVGPGATTSGWLATYADNTGNVLSATVNGTASQVLKGSATGAVAFGSINLDTDSIIGNLTVSHLNNGPTPGSESSVFWCGDGTWKVPAGGAGGSVTGPGATITNRIAVYGDTTGSVLSDDIIGTATQVLHGGTNGAVSFGAVNLATDVTGFLPVGNISASSGGNGALFLAGDGVWKTPPGGSTGTVNPGGPVVLNRLAVFTTNTNGTVIDDTLVGNNTQVLIGGDPPAFGVVLLNSGMVSGTLPVTKGGTGLSIGVTGGIPYFSDTTTLSTSANLADNSVVLGGGTGAPKSSDIGTTGQVFIGRTGLAPVFETLSGAIQIDINGVVSMRTGVVLDSPVITGSITQLNATMSQFVFSNTATPTPANTIIGKIRWDAGIDVGSQIVSEFYSQVHTTTTAATTDSWFVWNTRTDGTLSNVMTLGVKNAASTSPDLEVINGNIIISGAAKGLQVTGTGSISTTSGNISTTSGNITAGGALRTSASTTPIGYSVGAFKTQPANSEAGTPAGTGKGSSFVLDASCGAVTMNSASLAAAASVTFTMVNSAVGPFDLIIVNQVTGLLGSYMICPVPGNGQMVVTVKNIHASSTLSEALTFRFAIIKAAQSGALLAALQDRVEDALNEPQVDPEIKETN